HSLSGAWPKDLVRVRLERRKGAAPQYGRVEKILDRGIRAFVGRYAPVGKRSFVRFRDRDSDLLIEADLPHGIAAKAGDIVLAEITRYPERGFDGKALVIRRFGQSHSMETICLAVASSMDLPVVFTEDVVGEAEKIPKAVRLTAHEGMVRHGEETLPRADMRHLAFVTIDGEDAKDFDDAVCVVPEGDGFRLHVAIADVSHYVAWGSALDREALSRGTSVYFPDRCVPMLPPALSEGVCSLKPGVNRLTMNVEIPVRPGGATGQPSFYAAVIRSRARLTYTEVHERLSRKDEGEIGRMLRHMETAAGWLTLARLSRGSLDLNLPEARIDVESGMPVSVFAAPRHESHRIIEEFMLAANTAVAEFLARRGDPLLFRIHEEPAADKVDEFEAVAGCLLRRSRSSDRRDVVSRLRAWADIARGGKYEKIIQLMLLRSLMLARYSPEVKGHFGLALSRYVHFTSPIRRYPDLVVHRILRAALGDEALVSCRQALADKGERIGIHLSGRERVAMDAERAVMARAKALFMSGREGETFEGSVVSMVSFGFFVELDDWMVEGLVHISTLRDDEYRFSRDRMEWAGIYRRRRIALGDRVCVRVRRGDPDKGEIDFLLVEKLQ
ncbi:MAG: VacB/RNase II family 3'-5' exoribonuclease, partial [Syntrophorhabdaceae bacterium]|nr:VacB/RNase II family 3'-5' exoribonuclease [Syntrophorhabdaceae bacterium]